jgi:predicted nicotinamide N-methyase
MPVKFISKPLNGHPLTALQYEISSYSAQISGQTLELTVLSDVERSIDQVFQWLESTGREASEIERLAPYFGAVWPSALALTEYLLQESRIPSLVGTRFLELGCGLAIPAMMAARLGAKVTAMDNHPDVPRFLKANVQKNEPCHLQFAASSELSSADFVSANCGAFDLIVASDVLYEGHLAEHFAEEVTKFSNEHSTVIVADPGRPYIQAFTEAMARRGWHNEVILWTVQAACPIHSGRSADIFILKFVRR